MPSEYDRWALFAPSAKDHPAEGVVLEIDEASLQGTHPKFVWTITV